MKLLFSLEYYSPHVGGVETVFKYLCEGLAKKGHEVTIVTTKLPNTEKKEELNGVHIQRISTPFSSRYFFPLTSIFTLLRYAKKTDIIHTTTYTGAFPAWVAAKIRKKPALLTVHEVWLHKWKEVTEKKGVNAFLHNLAEKMLYFFPFDKYVCVSHATERSLKNVKKKDVVTIHNGMNYEHWNPKKYDGESIRKTLGLEGKYIFLGYGRPGTSKGFTYLIEAMKEIKKTVPNSALILILSKSNAYARTYEALQKQAKNLPIHWVEPQPFSVLPKYVKMADCVVVPSLSEGFGYVCVEANTMGKPVVATNNSSLPEVIEKGILVPPRNARALAEAMKKITEGKAEIFSKKTFFWKDTISKYERVYKEIA